MQIDQIVEKYVKVRDAKKKLKEKHAAELKPYDEAMDLAEAAILKQLQTLGADSVKTKFGTCYKSLQTTCTVADWSVLFEWIKNRELWPLLERRVNKSTVMEHISETGSPPPGVNVVQRVELNVRRE